MGYKRCPHGLSTQQDSKDDGPQFSALLDCFYVGFIQLLNTLEPRYKIPSRCYFTEKVILEIKRNTNLQITEVIKGVHYLSLTTDIRSTSLNNQ